MNGANEVATVKDGAREIALKKLREIMEKNLESAASMKRKERRESAQRGFRRTFRDLCETKFCFKEEDFAKLTVEDMYEIHKDLKRRAKIFSRAETFGEFLIPFFGWVCLWWWSGDNGFFMPYPPKHWSYHRATKILEKEYGPDWFQKIAKDLYN